MIKLFATIRKNYFDNTVELSKLSKTFSLWAIGLVFVYVSNIYLIKLIGFDLYGKYTVFISWVSLVSTLLTFGWDGYLIQKIPRLQRNEAGKITSTWLLGKAITTFLFLYVVCVLFIICIVYQGIEFSFADADQVIFFLILIFLFSLIALLKSFLKIFHVVASVQWIEDVLKPVVLFAIILFYYAYKTGLSLSSLYFINVLVFGGLATCLLFFSIRVYRENFKADQAAVVTEKWFKQCFYFMCIFLGYSIFSRMELLFLGYFSKNEEAAKYQILLRLADMVIIPDFLFNYFLPQKFSYYFASNNMDEAKTLFRNSAKTILLLQLLCFAGVSIVGYLYLQSFGIASMYMYVLLVILASAPVFNSLLGSSNLVLKTSGNERYSFYALVIILVLEGFANIVFIQSYGLKAAVIISWSGIVLYNFVLAFFVHRKLHFYSRYSQLLFSPNSKK